MKRSKAPNHGNTFRMEAVAIIAAVFASLLIFRGAFKRSDVIRFEFAAPVEVTLGKREAERPPPESVGIPVRIRIPSIAVDAVVEKVSLAPDGSMGVPKRPLDAAWYSAGPRPGEMGSAAIDGHVDWLDGATAVFADLHKLKSGDTLTVLDDQGTEIPFVVRESRVYGAGADTTDILSAHDDKAHLSIITCDGTWDKRAKQYTRRLVVFADRRTE